MGEEDVRQIVGEWRAEQHGPANRDTQFAGFAAVVIHEIDEALGEVVKWGVENDIDDQAAVQRELATRWLAIVSRRSYDLVKHTLSINECEQPVSAVIGQITDLTELPE